MKCGFVILNYNSWKMTKKLAEKVAEFDRIEKVVIVDNQSTDNSFEHLIDINCPKIKLIKSDKNGGYSYGNNIGVRYLSEMETDIAFISNPDVDIDEKDINMIINGFKKSDYSVLSAVELDIDGNIAQPPIYLLSSYWDDLADCFFISRKIKKISKTTEIDKMFDIQKVDLVKGSFFGVRLKDFEEVGYFDDEFFLFCEERTLGKKMKNAGKTIGILTGAVYHHNHSASIKNTYKCVSSQMKLLYQSRKLYHKKYLRTGIVLNTIMSISMSISLFEFRIKDFIGKSINSEDECFG